MAPQCMYQLPKEFLQEQEDGNRETHTNLTPTGKIKLTILYQIWILGNQMNNPKLDFD